ncbi:MAG: NADH-quinone oxidoreductase subunit B family protein [Verrucomicrobia bacterium]|nr:NADH-quinone oxidoreductase subunit B family protein [Verrucomicrobiota bacterium]
MLRQFGLKKSPWVVHFNCNSCNGCDIELLACLSPLYDLERFGIIHVGNPKHADVLLVTGSVNHRNARVLKNVYDQMPEPKAVVAVGVCASTGGIFRECYNVLGGIEEVVPVDVFVPGCPARPEAVIDGIVKAAEKLDLRRRGQPVSRPSLVPETHEPSPKPAAPPETVPATPASPAAPVAAPAELAKTP